MRVTYTYNAIVNKVIDGDTMDCTVDAGFGIYCKQRFRIKDFDAPEIWHPRNDAEFDHGKRAQVMAAFLLPIDSGIVLKSYKGIGVYGRYEAEITLPDGRDFVTVMRGAGMEKQKEYL